MGGGLFLVAISKIQPRISNIKTLMLETLLFQQVDEKRALFRYLEYLALAFRHFCINF